MSYERIIRVSLTLAIIALIGLIIPHIPSRPQPFISPFTSPLGLKTTESIPMSPQPLPTAPYNLGFESTTTTHWAYWWDPSGGPYYSEFGEVNSPEGWTPVIFDRFVCPGTPYWVTGRPEVGKITTNVDLTRVRSGNQALKLFTFHRCHIAGVYQQFATIPGMTYRLTAYAHTWSSNCSILPHYTDCALDWDCRTCMYPDHSFYVGLDPNGGINPFSSKRSPPHHIHGQYAEPLTIIATATGDTMTAFLLGVAPLPWRHNDDYWDDITIEPVIVYHTPIVLRNYP